MKLITLTQGKFAEVDDADYDCLNKWSWRALLNKTANKWYAVRTGEGIDQTSGKIVPKMFSMHRYILELTDSNIYGDHIDGNSLNNQRCNLRASTPSQNSMNRKCNKNSYSKYNGVSFKTRIARYKSLDGIREYPHSYYETRILVKNVRIYLGQYPNTPEGEVKAALAYDKAAKQYFGEFANLNFKT